MGQVKSVVPLVGQAAPLDQSVLKQVESAPKRVLTAAERHPDQYIRNQKLKAMSGKQLQGELRRLARRQHIPREIQLNPKTGAVRGLNKESGPLVDAALAIVLKIMLDSYKRGVSPFPR